MTKKWGEEVTKRPGGNRQLAVGSRLVDLLIGRMVNWGKVCALPFAYMGAVLAATGIPSKRSLFWIPVAMVGTRRRYMGMNWRNKLETGRGPRMMNCLSLAHSVAASAKILGD